MKRRPLDGHKVFDFVKKAFAVLVNLCFAFTVLILLALVGSPDPPLAPGIQPVIPLRADIILLFLIGSIVTLNGLLSCLWTMHPCWGAVFLTMYLGVFADMLVWNMNGWMLFIVSFWPLLFLFVGIAASVITLIARRGEWKTGIRREQPAAWVDALIGLAFVAPLVFLWPLLALIGAARHIYIVRELIIERRKELKWLKLRAEEAKEEGQAV